MVVLAVPVLLACRMRELLGWCGWLAGLGVLVGDDFGEHK